MLLKILNLIQKKFYLIAQLIFLWGLIDTILSYTDGGDLWYQLLGIYLPLYVPEVVYQYSGIGAMVLGGVIFSLGNKK